MKYQTVVAVYDTAEHAQAAYNALRMGGFSDADISLLDYDRLRAGKSDISEGASKPGFWARLFGNDLHEHEAVVFSQTVEQGGVVVSARVIDSEVAHATAILDLHHPIDVHDRAVTLGIAPLAHVEAVEKKLEAIPLAAKQTVAVTPKLAEVHDEVLRLAEEQLQVGKRMIETGRTRVRRFVTEREVSADVTLHEEHAELLRHAVSDPKFAGTVDWADREIEVVETDELALVNKTARIVEEVSLKKIGTDRVETIKDKLRRQQVEVTRVGAGGKVIVGQNRPIRSQPD